MTPDQRKSIFKYRWPAACRAQGWDSEDRALRLQVFSQAVGRFIKSAGELNNTTDIDALYAHLGQLADNVRRTMETLPAGTVQLSAGRRKVAQPDSAGQRRRIAWKIRDYAEPLGGEPYILAVARDKFHITAGLTTLDDLSTEQLHGLMMTLARAASRAQRRQVAAEPPAAEPEPVPEVGMVVEYNCPNCGPVSGVIHDEECDPERDEVTPIVYCESCHSAVSPCCPATEPVPAIDDDTPF